MDIRKTLEDEIMTLELSGDFDTTEVETFAAEITESIDADIVRVLVDMEGLGFVNSTALGCLLKAQKQLSQYGGGMAAAGPSASVRRVFEILQLDKKIPLFAGREQAVAHLESLNPEGVSAAGEEIAFFLPDAETTFGTKSRRGRLEEMREDGLTLSFDNLDGLDPEDTFVPGAEVALQFRLPLYHPSHVFKPEGKLDGYEVLGRETIALRVTFTTIAEHEREAVQQYVKDLRFLKDDD